MDYREINKKAWNDKTDVHIASDFYAMEAFRAGKNTLNEIELPLLADVTSKSILHLQCHFGQDSMSLQRMGAQVTGVDLSDKAIQRAKEIAAELGLETQFICCDIYDTQQYIQDKFDIVFTSYGTIGWLPDLDKWATVIQSCLKPGGRFVMADFHPVIWMFDNDFEKMVYSYFNDEDIVEEENGTYADKQANITAKTISWNHSLSELLQALLGVGLQIKQFHEYNYSPYACFKHVEEFEPGKFRFKQHENRLPMVYALEAVLNDEC